MPTITQYGANNSLAQEVPDLNVVIVPPQLILTGAPSDIEGVVGVGSWGPLDTPVTVSGLSDATTAFGPMTVRKHDLTTAVYVGALQGSNDFRAVRVGDGTQTAASVAIPAADVAASPTFFAALAAAVNQGSGVLRGASQVASLDGVTGLLTALHTGVVGNSVSMSVGAGAKNGTYRGVLRLAGSQPEVYDNIPSATPPTFKSYNLAGGTNGDAGVTSATLVGEDIAPGTGAYALRGQGTSVFVVADLDDPTQWTTLDALALSEATYAVHQVEFGTSVPAAVALRNGEGLDSRYSKLMHGDGLYVNDTVNGVVRLVSPSSVVAGKLAALAPNRSPLNKPLAGIVGSQSSGAATGATGRYSTATLAQLLQAGIDVVCNPQPGGAFWGVRGGRNTSSNPATRQDASTTMNNFIATSIAALMGTYVGEPISSDLLQAISSTLNAFGASLLSQGLLGDPSGSVPYRVLCDASNNPGASTGLGFVRAVFKVRTQAILEDFEIDLEDGPTVALASNAGLAA